MDMEHQDYRNRGEYTMKRKLHIGFMVLFCLLITGIVLPVRYPGIRTVQAASVQTAVAGKAKQTTGENASQKTACFKKKDGKLYYIVKGLKVKDKWSRVRNCWKTIEGDRYYFQKDGSAATGGTKIGSKVYVFSADGKLIRKTKSAVVAVGKNLYYVDKNGVAQTGWFKVGKKLCYADSSGRMKKSKTYQNITFDANGYAKSDTAAKAKLTIMSVYSSVTNSKMTQSQKLRACWNYLCGGKFRYSTLYYPNINEANWVNKCALNMFERHAGNCYGFACAFAALAREAGYSVDVVAGRVRGPRDGAADGYTRHCWVRIGGLYYDPEAQYAGWYRGLYGYSSYPVWPHQVTKIEHLV